MTSRRDEYGHYVNHNDVIHLSQDVGSQPVTRGGRMLSIEYVVNERIDNVYFLYELTNRMAGKTPEDIQGGFYV